MNVWEAVLIMMFVWAIALAFCGTVNGHPDTD